MSLRASSFYFSSNVYLNYIWQMRIFQESLKLGTDSVSFSFSVFLFLSLFCLHLFESVSCIYSNVPLMKHLYMGIYFHKFVETVRLSVHILYKLQSEFRWISSHSRWRWFKKGITGSWEKKMREARWQIRSKSFCCSAPGKSQETEPMYTWARGWHSCLWAGRGTLWGGRNCQRQSLGYCNLLICFQA